MLRLDTIGRWVALATGRTLDQHAADPIPAAAHLPEAAATLRHRGPSCCSRWAGCAPY